MRVLHVISSGGMYGAEGMILQLMHALEAAGDASTVAIFDNRSAPNEEFPAAARRAGLAVERILCHGQLDRHAPARIASLVRQWRPDIVHTHGYKSDLYTAVALRNRRAGRPALIATCHSWIDTGIAVKVYGALDRLALRRFDTVVAVADEIVDRLLAAGVPRDRVHLVANGLDPQPFADAVPGVALSGPASEPPLVVQMARLSPEKGADIFLRAFAGLHRAGIQARGALWGEGPERQALEALRHELALDHLVSMPGRRDDIPSALAEVDLLVAASRQEGLSMSLLEGMASARAIIATPVGKVPDVLRDNTTGVIVPVEDVDALAAAMAALLSDPSRRRALGAAARAEVHARFSAQAMAAHYRALYAETLARLGGSA